MSSFNSAFRKVFLGNSKNPSADLDNGFLVVNDVASSDLKSTYGVGVFGLFDPNSLTSGGKPYPSVQAGDAQITGGKPLILAASALYQHDKVGPFIGGYQETNKSKMINPKFVTEFYRVDPCSANPNVVHVGLTPFTDTSPATAGCCHDFQCNNTYWLRVDIKGSPVLRALTRNAYWTADAYTGCCTDPASPGIVDPTTVYIKWATGLLGQGVKGDSNFIPNAIVGPYIAITIYDTTGKAWYQPGTNGGVDEWDAYVSLGESDAATHGCNSNDPWMAGMKLQGAYVDTKFGDCTFYPSDFFEKEPVQIYISETDNLGDPCTFTGICVVEQCCPRQGQGFGEQVLRDLILSESYLQNYFNTNLDLRIREITQGYDVSAAVDRAALYYHYFIQHHVPRYNNPSGLFDNDQYLIEIVTNAPSTVFESTLATWLTACGCGTTLSTYECGEACPCSDPIVLNTDDANTAFDAGDSVDVDIYVDGGCDENRKITLKSGSLPPGLTLDEDTGTISGTLDTPSPAVSKLYQFCIEGTDNCGCDTTQCYNWLVQVTP